MRMGGRVNTTRFSQLVGGKHRILAIDDTRLGAYVFSAKQMLKRENQ